MEGGNGGVEGREASWRHWREEMSGGCGGKWAREKMKAMGEAWSCEARQSNYVRGERNSRRGRT